MQANVPMLLFFSADNDIASEGDALPSTMNHSPEFLVPQLRNTPMNWRRETANGGLPEVPNLDRSTSPVLHIGGGSNWASRENQAHAPSQRRSDLPLSSHLSFSESLTDDSENLNEFDLLFENSPKHNGSNPKQNGSTRKQNGGTFHAYVNEVFDDIFIDDYDSCEKVKFIFEVYFLLPLLQVVEVYCRVKVAVYCNLLQCECCSLWQNEFCQVLQCVEVCCRANVAVCCRKSVAVCDRMYVVVCWELLKCVAD